METSVASFEHSKALDQLARGQGFDGMAGWLSLHGAGWPMLVWFKDGPNYHLSFTGWEGSTAFDYIPALPYIAGEGVCSVFGFLEEALGLKFETWPQGTLEAQPEHTVHWKQLWEVHGAMGGFFYEEFRDTPAALLTAILERVAHETEAK